MNLKLNRLKYGIPILIIILFIILAKDKAQPKCTAIPTPAILNTSEADGSTVNLTWTNGQNSQMTYLNVSTSQSTKPDGSLEDPDIVNDAVTNKTSYLKSNLMPGTYYWNVVTDACKQRKVSELKSFTIQPTTKADCELTPAVLNTPVIKDSTVTFSWTNDQNTEASYINVSSSNEINDNGVLQTVDIANDVVSNNTSFTKENIASGTYYWNIASDGCGQRKISELGTFSIE
ncbi:hypothetical protein HYU93_01885 [Candidatus Daviesbacteria bacterium]|nr:hypothetical protein [Candidatus Daviesbacteria bacterium]